MINPWDLSASDLLIWGIVVHLVADWPLQNDWMANNKMKRGVRGKWYLRHVAAHAHAWVHILFLSMVFGWPIGVLLGLTHLIIDTRWPVVKWSQFIGQTQPKPPVWLSIVQMEYQPSILPDGAPLMDVGMEVRFWTDQVFHIICIAAAALLVHI